MLLMQFLQKLEPCQGIVQRNCLFPGRQQRAIAKVVDGNSKCICSFKFCFDEVPYTRPLRWFCKIIHNIK